MSFNLDIQKTRELHRSISQFDLDLSSAVTDERMSVAGNFVYFLHAPDEINYIFVRFNDLSNPSIKLYRGMGLYAPFERIYITKPSGQTGDATIMHGRVSQAEFAIVDNRSVTVENLADIKGQLTGDATPEDWGAEKTIGTSQAQVLDSNSGRKGCILHSKESNTGNIYIGFDDTVTATKWIAELTPGAAFTIDNYLGALHVISDTASQKLGWGEW